MLDPSLSKLLNLPLGSIGYLIFKTVVVGFLPPVTSYLQLPQVIIGSIGYHVFKTVVQEVLNFREWLFLHPYWNNVDINFV